MMRGMPFQPEAVLLSLQVTSVETVCNVAVVGAVFPGAVFTDCKCPPTMTAGDLASVAMVNQFRVSVPPFGSASIRAEHPGFPPWSLNQGCAAALTRLFQTARLVRNSTAQRIPFTVGFDGIYGQPHQLSNLFIAVALPTKGGYLAFL